MELMDGSWNLQKLTRWSNWDGNRLALLNEELFWKPARPMANCCKGSSVLTVCVRYKVIFDRKKAFSSWAALDPERGSCWVRKKLGMWIRCRRSGSRSNRGSRRYHKAQLSSIWTLMQRPKYALLPNWNANLVVLPDFCHSFYTDKIFVSKIVHPKTPKTATKYKITKYP